MTTATTGRAETLVARVADAIRTRADQMERERQMPPELFAALASAGLFRLYMPAELGEGGMPTPDALRVVEEVARIDGSAGWTVALGFSAGLFTAGLDPEFARLVTASGGLIAGRGGQPGRAVVVEGGYRVTGQWSYVSGCLNADWFCCDAIIVDGDVPRMQATGMPEDILFFVPRTDTEIIDTWHVSGLKGSGSHDIRVSNVFVPAEMAMPGPLSAKSSWKRVGTQQRIPFMLELAISQAPAVCLGIARHAIEAFKKLAETKNHTASRRPLRERPSAAIALGRAEAQVQSARAFFYDSLEQMWDLLSEGKDLPPEEHAVMRLACVNAAESSTAAVDSLWRMAGSSSLFETCELDRCWRDVHAAAQHLQVQESSWESAGRVLLGLDPGTFVF